MRFLCEGMLLLVFGTIPAENIPGILFDQSTIGLYSDIFNMLSSRYFVVRFSI